MTDPSSRLEPMPAGGNDSQGGFEGSGTAYFIPNEAEIDLTPAAVLESEADHAHRGNGWHSRRSTGDSAWDQSTAACSAALGTQSVESEFLHLAGAHARVDRFAPDLHRKWPLGAGTRRGNVGVRCARVFPFDGKDGSGRDLPTGGYFVRLDSDRVSAAGKVLVVR